MGFTCCAIFAAVLPGFCLLFGNMIDSVGGREPTEQMKKNCLIMVGLGVVTFVFASTQICLFSIFSQRMSHKIRLIYFEKCLALDAKFYDGNSAAEMASKISKECTAIQRGFGEKVGQTFNAGM